MNSKYPQLNAISPSAQPGAQLGTKQLHQATMRSPSSVVQISDEDDPTVVRSPCTVVLDEDDSMVVRSPCTVVLDEDGLVAQSPHSVMQIQAEDECLLVSSICSDVMMQEINPYSEVPQSSPIPLRQDATDIRVIGDRDDPPISGVPTGVYELQVACTDKTSTPQLPRVVEEAIRHYKTLKVSPSYSLYDVFKSVRASMQCYSTSHDLSLAYFLRDLLCPIYDLTPILHAKATAQCFPMLNEQDKIVTQILGRGAYFVLGGRPEGRRYPFDSTQLELGLRHLLVMVPDLAKGFANVESVLARFVSVRLLFLPSSWCFEVATSMSTTFLMLHGRTEYEPLKGPWARTPMEYIVPFRRHGDQSGWR